MATNALALPAELNEELETIKSILTQDTRVVHSQDGTIMVTLDLPRGEMETEKSHEITFILSSELFDVVYCTLLTLCFKVPYKDDYLIFDAQISIYNYCCYLGRRKSRSIVE